MAAISKQEYLKRYLSNSEGVKKKKKKKIPKTASRHPTSIIVDDDITIRDIKTRDSAQETNEFEGDVDEAPAVYEEDGVTKISLETFKKREEDQKTKWAPISQESQSLFHTEVGNRLNSNSNNSTPRMTSRDGEDTPDLSPRRSGVLFDLDQSPPRKKGRAPPGSSVRDSSSDGRRDVSREADHSPPRARRRRHDSGDSLPEQKHSHSPDLSPSRQSRLQGSPDRSPRRRVRNDSPDLSPPCSGLNGDSDQSPPRKRMNSDSDQSPPRKRANSDSDQSPPRKQNSSENTSTRIESKKQRRQIETQGLERMSSGRKAGLLSADDLKRESERKREREAEMFAKLDPSISGKGSETVYRDKMGRKKDIKLGRIKRREEERKEMEDNEKFMEWGRGVTQTKQTQDKVADYLHEVDKPLARYRDDEDLEKMLKDQEREDDPMLAYMKQKKTKQNIREGKKEKPVYKGRDPPPNRFNIRPGYRWDGVDRSNGFERKRFAMLANKMATQTQAYKWSTEDM